MNNILQLLLVSILGTSVLAHDLWVTVSHKDKVYADMIYGHDFPNPEVIAEERLALFEPVSIIGKDGTRILSQKGENYSYVGKEKLKKGAYVVRAYYKPTSWMQTSDGKWEMNKTRKDTQKEVTHCGTYSMQGKSILVVDAGDDDFITKPLGKGLEITLLVRASEIKEGKAIKFKVTMDGKKLKFKDVYGSLEGYSENDMSKAYYGKTNLAGEIVFKPLKKGFWYLHVKHKRDSGNKDCEITQESSTLSFHVK